MSSVLSPDKLFAIDTIIELQVTSTWEEIAQKLDMHIKTLWGWRQDPAFQAELKKRSRRMLGEHLPVGYGALLRNVRKGETASLKMFFELTGEFGDAKLKQLFGSWIAYLGIAGKDHIRQLMGLVVEARKAQGGAIEAEVTVVDEYEGYEEEMTRDVPFDEI